MPMSQNFSLLHTYDNVYINVYSGLLVNGFDTSAVARSMILLQVHFTPRLIPLVSYRYVKDGKWGHQVDDERNLNFKRTLQKYKRSNQPFATSPQHRDSLRENAVRTGFYDAVKPPRSAHDVSSPTSTRGRRRGDYCEDDSYSSSVGGASSAQSLSSASSRGGASSATSHGASSTPSFKRRSRFGSLGLQEMTSKRPTDPARPGGGMVAASRRAAAGFPPAARVLRGDSGLGASGEDGDLVPPREDVVGAARRGKGGCGV